ncbi:MAG TPA: pseudouridine synthase, partial [Paludibacter sp.]|nr:pseudouridine synthase [Paludibacter sp.]
SGAGRDGKPYEKRDVKSILKGSRGASKFANDKPEVDYNREPGKLEFKKRDPNSQPFAERKPYENREGDRPRFIQKKPYESGNQGYGDRRPSGNRFESPERKPYGNRFESPERKPYGNRENNDRPYGNRENSDRPYGNRENTDRPYGNRVNRSEGGDRPTFKRPRITTQLDGERRYKPVEDRNGDRLAFKKTGENSQTQYIETRFDNKKDGTVFRKPHKKREGGYDSNDKYSQKKQLEYKKTYIDLTKPVRLNKFLANAGICSRREADEFIQAGVISVNGEIVNELGVKVMHSDKIMFHNQLVRSERKVYILLNKPKDCVTTTEDTHDRLTVIDIVKNACSERIYPVGRLDRNTTGVILLTNDGDLASKLTHPKYDKKKIYHTTLDKPLETADFETILAGVMLDDEKIAADALEYVKDGDPKQIGIEIHSGQNRVVRRIFESLGYKVIRLDRVYFAGLTKKNVPRGKYRFLNEREVNMLKMGAYE